ncbi:hypothetical protein M501DRAFT_988455 [Patellaria atrata CBS 101060]|uniref:Uncharacterized protein n=1 Tax=Patellaria atrata CBS 101060 TaxID=1346257 RepID=A0A9P4SGY5_9PEZI|nr:hypothetical protein M501DRAFT_988455 [Patellaria atrata CBS 101060]
MQQKLFNILLASASLLSSVSAIPVAQASDSAGIGPSPTSTIIWSRDAPKDYIPLPKPSSTIIWNKRDPEAQKNYIPLPKPSSTIVWSKRNPGPPKDYIPLPKPTSKITWSKRDPEAEPDDDEVEIVTTPGTTITWGKREAEAEPAEAKKGKDTVIFGKPTSTISWNKRDAEPEPAEAKKGKDTVIFGKPTSTISWNKRNPDPVAEPQSDPTCVNVCDSNGSNISFGNPSTTAGGGTPSTGQQSPQPTSSSTITWGKRAISFEA